MNLIKTGGLTAISTLIKIISGFIVNKIVAVYVGPTGIAIIGQFQNFITIIMNFANGAINRGTIKYIAEYHDNALKRKKILSTSFLISLSCALLFSLVLIIFHSPLSFYFLKNLKYSSIILIFGFTLAFFSLNTFFLSVLNGHGEIKKIIIIGILSNLISLLFTIILVNSFKLYGALLSIITADTIIFFITLIFITNCSWFKIDNLLAGIDKESFIKLGKYSLMSITSAITAPVSQIIVRNYIAGHLNLDSAGFWQGVVKISDVYLMLITSSLGVYYLPKLSALKTNIELRKELFYGYKTILPIVGILALGVYLFRDLTIKILFTDKFMAMSSLFGYQLLGDFFKIASWLLSYLMVAKAMTKYFIATEIIFSFSYVVLVIILVDINGLIGTTQAFMINYLLYLTAMIFIFKDLIFKKREINE